MDFMARGYRLPSHASAPRVGRDRLEKMRKHPARVNLAAHFGRRAVQEALAGRGNNAAELAEVSCHHALEVLGRRTGDRQRLDNIAFCMHSDLA